MSGSAEPRRVAVVSHTGELGGAEGALLRLLAEIDGDRFTVAAVVLAPGPFVERLEAAGVHTTVVAGGDVVRVTREQTVGRGALRNLRDALALAGRLRRMLADDRPDLVVANSLKSAVLMAAVAPLVRVPWVWHLHDRIAPDYLPGPVVTALRGLARIAPRVVVANSSATAVTLGQGARCKTVIAYPGLDEASFASPRRFRAAGRVGIIGRISATKGQREFLAAAQIVASEHPRLRYAIVGSALFEDAPVERALKAESAASPIADRVRWTGWVDDPGRVLRRLRMLVHASPVPEPFGQVVTEAMAAGVPVIATDAGGVPEIVDPEGEATIVADGVRCGPFGVLVRPGDSAAIARAIVWQMTHPAQSAQMVRSAGASARARFSIARTAAVVMDAWERAARV